MDPKNKEKNYFIQIIDCHTKQKSKQMDVDRMRFPKFRVKTLAWLPGQPRFYDQYKQNEENNYR